MDRCRPRVAGEALLFMSSSLFGRERELAERWVGTAGKSTGGGMQARPLRRGGCEAGGGRRRWARGHVMKPRPQGDDGRRSAVSG